MDDIRIHRLLGTAALMVAVMASPMAAWAQDTTTETGAAAFIEHFDKDGDGYVSLDEFAGNQDQFQDLDADGDGYIDTAEASRQPPQRRPEPRDILSDFDADGDGQLSEDEFPGPNEHFGDLDADGDGFLNQEELSAGRPGPPKGVSFNDDDADQDGVVSQSEFTGPEDVFDRLDADGDGYITQAEARVGGPGPRPDRSPAKEPWQQ